MDPEDSDYASWSAAVQAASTPEQAAPPARDDWAGARDFTPDGAPTPGVQMSSPARDSWASDQQFTPSGSPMGGVQSIAQPPGQTSPGRSREPAARDNWANEQRGPAPAERNLFGDPHGLFDWEMQNKLTLHPELMSPRAWGTSRDIASALDQFKALGTGGYPEDAAVIEARTGRPVEEVAWDERQALADKAWYAANVNPELFDAMDAYDRDYFSANNRTRR